MVFCLSAQSRLSEVFQEICFPISLHAVYTLDGSQGDINPCSTPTSATITSHIKRDEVDFCTPPLSILNNPPGCFAFVRWRCRRSSSHGCSRGHQSCKCMGGSAQIEHPQVMSRGSNWTLMRRCLPEGSHKEGINNAPSTPAPRHHQFKGTQ